MTIAIGRKLTLSSNTRSAWLPLAHGRNRIFIKCGNWAGSSLAMKINSEDTTLDSDLKDEGGPIVVTANEVLDIEGPCLVAGVLSNYGGTPIVLEALDKSVRI